MAKEETKEEIIGRLYALRAGLSVIAVENDEITNDRFVADKTNTTISRKKEIVGRTREKFLSKGYELTPIKNREDQIRDNEEKIKDYQMVLQKKPKEVKWNLQWGDLIFLFLALICFFASFACIYWCVLGIITDMGELSGLERVSGWMAKSQGPIHWIQRLYYLVDKKVVYEIYNPNASSMTKQEWKWFSLTWILPAVFGVAFLVFGVICCVRFFTWFDFGAIVQVKSNEKELKDARAEINKLIKNNESLKMQVEELKMQVKGMNETEFFVAYYKEQEEMLRRIMEKETKAKIDEIEWLEESLKEIRNNIRKRIMRVKEYREKLVENYQDFLDERDWDKIDFLIYLVETNRAKSITEGLNIVDTKIWQNDIQNSIQEIKEVGQRIVSTIREGIGDIYNAMAKGFSILHKDILQIRMDNLKTNKVLIESSQRQEQLQLMQLETQRAAIAKANETSKSLADIAQKVSRMKDFEEYGHQQRIRTGV